MAIEELILFHVEDFRMGNVRLIVSNYGHIRTRRKAPDASKVVDGQVSDPKTPKRVDIRNLQACITGKTLVQLS